MSQKATALEPTRSDPISPVKVDYAAILKDIGLDPNDPKAQAVVLVCQRYDLDPVLRHVLLIKPTAGEEARLYITRDGLLHVAHKSGQLNGIQVLEQTETDTHFRAVVAVYRKDMDHPFTYVGRYQRTRLQWVDDLDAQGKKIWEKGDDGKSRPRRKQEERVHPYGPEMAVKCAESMCLRRAFDVAIASREEAWDAPDIEDAAFAEPVPVPVAQHVEPPTHPHCQAIGPQGEVCTYSPLHATDFHSWDAPAEVAEEEAAAPPPAPRRDPKEAGERARIIALIRKKAEERNVADQVLWDDLGAMSIDELKDLFNRVGSMTASKS